MDIKKIIYLLASNIFTRINNNYTTICPIGYERRNIRKMENLRTKIYLMVITLDLNLIENNENEAYNQEEDFTEIFYYNLNKIENGTIE